MAVPVLVVVAVAILFVVRNSHAFVPRIGKRAFVTPPHHMTAPTTHYNDWDLPEEVPGDRSSSSNSKKDASTSLPELSETRRSRLEKEASLKRKFVTGDDLHRLRQHAMSLREELQQARSLQATRRAHELEQAILKVQQVDAEFVYRINLERMHAAQEEGRDEDYERYHETAMEARSALPQYNLDGLWVGK